MAYNKKEEFKKIDNQVADFAKALSHPARISILKILSKKNQCICGEIVEVLPLSQSTVSQHLIELKKAGIVKGKIDGPRSCYCIDWKNLLKQMSAFENVIKNIIEQ